MAPEGMVTFDSGGDVVRGYLARPAGPAPRPGLVLVPDVHGLSEHYRDLARRWAAAGYVTLAVDLYSREGAPTLPDLAAVTAWIRALPDERVIADLLAARGYLSAQGTGRPRRVAITGHCMGGMYALLSACRDDGWGACVSWYGMLRYAHYDACNPASPIDVAPRLGCPLLGLYGEDDPLIPRTDLEAWRRALVESGQPVEIRTYPGAGHAFFNDTRPDAFRPAAAADAWARACAFLRERLG